MSKFQEILIKYDKEFTRIGVKYDKKLLEIITRSCGPSIYNANSSRISSSSKQELDRVKKNFLIKKLGLVDSPKLDDAISEVIGILGKPNRNKYRAIFYYLLVKKFRKSRVYSNQFSSKSTRNSNNRRATKQIVMKKVEKNKPQKKSIKLSTFYDKIVSEDSKLLKRLAE